MLKTTINTQIAFRFYESEINAHIETLKQEDLRLIQSICSKIGIDYRYVFIKRRYRELVTARRIIVAILDKKLYRRYDILKIFTPCNYHHKDVIHALEAHDNLIKYDSEYQAIFNLTNHPKQLRPCGMSLVKGDKF